MGYTSSLPLYIAVDQPLNVAISTSVDLPAAFKAAFAVGAGLFIGYSVAQRIDRLVRYLLGNDEP